MLWLTAAMAETLTYEACLAEALDFSPGVQRAKLDAEAASAGVRSALGFMDPQAGFDGSWRQSKSRGFFQGFPFESDSKTWDLGASLSGTTPTGTGYSLNAGLDRNFSRFTTDFGIGQNDQEQDAYTSNFNVTLTQELLRGILPAFNMQSVHRSRRAVTTAELRALDAAQQTLAETARLYWDWAYRVELYSISSEAVGSAEEALRIGELKLTAGEIAPLERTRLKAAAVQAKVSAMDAQIASRQALSALLSQIGREEGPYAVGSNAETLAVSTVDREAELSTALTNNLQIRLARAAIEDAGIELKNAKHATLPSLKANVSAGIGAQDTSAGKALSGITQPEAFPYLQVGGSFSMPLLNRTARGASSQAAITKERAQIDLAEAERSVRDAVRRQVEVVNSGALRVELANTNADLAKESLAAEEALQSAGRSIQKNLLDARSEVTRTAAEVAKARTDHQVALVELNRLQGRLAP